MFYGSISGVLLSLTVILFMMTYFGYLYLNMLSYNKDVYNSQALVNEFKEGQNSFNMYDFNFIPSMEINLIKEKPTFREEHKAAP